MNANNNLIKKAYLSLPIGQIHYRTNDCEDGIPLILLHRTPSSSIMYEPIIREMFHDRPLYAIDTPGFGSSFDPNGSPDMKDYRDWMCESIDALGIDKFHIYAHHTGTHIAAEIANAWKDRTISLILNGVAYLDEDERESFKKMTSSVVERDIEGKYLLESFELMKSLFPSYDSHLVNTEFLGAIRSIKGREQAFAAVWDQDFKSLIKTIRAPLMVMSAIDDFFYNKLDIIKKELEGVQIEPLAESGIASTELQTKETVRLISTFMKKAEKIKV